jgi:polysaccharide pyruvyl transferase WcaK-like protein
MRLLLIGNYGAGNLGDEALKDYFLGQFPEHDWTVLTAWGASPVGQKGQTRFVPRLPTGLRSFFMTPWLNTLQAYWRCDATVFGGGSLFTDVESPKACTLWGLHALLAVILRKPVFLAFQGIGPFHTSRGRFWGTFAVRHAQFVSVRDILSFSRVRDFMKDTKIVQTFDPVFSQIQKEKIMRNPKNVLIVIPRKNSDQTFESRMKELMASTQFDGLRILSLEPDSREEQQVCSRLLLMSLQKGSVTPIRTLRELALQVSEAALVLTARYHGGIAALAVGVPLEIVAQGTDDKLSSLKTMKTPDVAELVQAGEEALRTVLNALQTGQGRDWTN